MCVEFAHILRGCLVTCLDYFLVLSEQSCDVGRTRPGFILRKASEFLVECERASEERNRQFLESALV